MVYARVMGATHVTVTVVNPADLGRRWDGLFLVDTGAANCLVPAKCLRSIGILPDSKRVFELADGTEATFETAVARIEFMGEIVGATVIFGNDGKKGSAWKKESAWTGRGKRGQPGRGGFS
jgi:predicted aspartyl protease